MKKLLKLIAMSFIYTEAKQKAEKVFPQNYKRKSVIMIIVRRISSKIFAMLVVMNPKNNRAAHCMPMTALLV